MKKTFLYAALFMTCVHCLDSTAQNSQPHLKKVTISNLKELVHYARQSDYEVTMTPGVYPITDLITADSVAAMRARKYYQLIQFSGDNNVFLLNGVTILSDTRLRTELRPPIHNNEYQITGNGNTFVGLEIKNTGDAISPAGALISIDGRENTLRNCTFTVRGSTPYGYGDLFGKGGDGAIPQQKKSGVHITGSGTKLYGCKLYMQSYGHGYYIQEGPSDVYLEDCYVEGAFRATDDMLAETSGPAYDVQFRTVVRNRQGEHVVTPGYAKSLSEDGFRTYADPVKGDVRNAKFVRCTAKNMRGAFELRTPAQTQLENCTSIGAERAFWMRSGTAVCEGDACHGPLFFIEGQDVELTVNLTATDSPYTVHALGTIYGSGHTLIITSSGDKCSRMLPILVGYSPPPQGEGMSPYNQGEAKNIRIINHTSMPIIIGPKASGCHITTKGEVLENHGTDITIIKM